MTKILVSYGFGAGWSTWADDQYKKYCLTYAPFIEKLERGGVLTKEDGEQFIRDLTAKFPREDGKDAYFYLGGMDGLEVEEVDGPFLIHEYDGSESVNTPSNQDWMEI